MIRQVENERYFEVASILRRYAVALLEGSDDMVGIELVYDPAHPLVISLVFDSGVHWWISRELLSNGMLRLTGRGDVSVRPTDDGEVRIRLRGEGSVQIYRLGTDFLNRFLVQTYTEVPHGEEDPTVWNDLDNALTMILAGE